MKASKGAGRLLTWVMWSRQNALTAFMVTTFVFLIGVGYVLVRVIYGYQVSQYEAEQAEQAQRARSGSVATAPGGVAGGAAGDDRWSPLRDSPTSPGGGTAPPTTGPGATEPGQAIPSGALPPTPSATGRPEIATGDANLEAAPRAAAGAFLKVWLAAPTYPSDRAWAAALAPHSSTELAKLFEMTDRASVPRVTVAGLTSATIGTTSQVSAKLSSGASVALVLERGADAVWRVVDVAPEAR